MHRQLLLKGYLSVFLVVYIRNPEPVKVRVCLYQLIEFLRNFGGSYFNY